MQDRSIVIRGNRRRNPLESRVIFARGHKVLDGCTKKASSMIKKVEILEKWKRGWTVPSPVLLLLLHHPSPFFFSSGGKDSEDSATLWVTLASRIVYRVMSLHTGASAPLSFSLSPDPSPSVPFHSILPRSRHCSAVPFIRNKVSSDPAQCTPVFLGSLYLFLSSSSAFSLSPPTLPVHPFREIFVLSSLLQPRARSLWTSPIVSRSSNDRTWKECFCWLATCLPNQTFVPWLCSRLLFRDRWTIFFF